MTWCIGSLKSKRDLKEKGEEEKKRKRERATLVDVRRKGSYGFFLDFLH